MRTTEEMRWKTRISISGVELGQMNKDEDKIFTWSNKKV